MGTDAPPPSTDASARAAPSEESLRRAFDAGRAAYGPLALSFERFRDDFVARVARRTERGDDLEAAAAKRAGADLFLAAACEADVPGAWARLDADLRPRLRALAYRLLGAGAEADALAAEVIGDLATPPPGGRARTLLGTFDGLGSLFGWLAATLARRAYRATRAQREAPLSLDAGEEDTTTAAAAASPRLDGVDPLERAVGAERAARFRDALGRTWRTLTPNEQFVLLGKFRGGLDQRALARMLGVGPPRVTRLVQQVVAKLRDAATRALGTDDPTDGRGLDALLDVVQRELATREAPAPPTLGGRSTKGCPDDPA